MRLRWIGLVVLLLAVSLNVSAQRRRAVRSPAKAVTPGGNCVTFGAPRVGMKASYLTTSPSGNVTYTVTYVSESATEARTTQKVQTPQANADVETRMDFETVHTSFDLRALKHLYVKSTTSAAGFPFSVETDIDFVPSMILGPTTGWCQGATWTVPATTETITVKSIAGPQISTQTTIAFDAEVLSVNETITTPAGTFRCVKARGYQISGTTAAPTISWNSVEHYITVRQETLDANGAVSQVTELQKIE